MNHIIKILRTALLGLCVSVFLVACSQQRFDFSTGGNLAEDRMSDFFIYGMFQDDRIDAAGICGGADKVATVEAQLTFVNALLGAVSGGVYTPRQYRVYCLR